MVTLSLLPTCRHWQTVSFASTLYLCPILDYVLADVPESLQGDVRLGLQEALVNAAKHGNKLDPSKTVCIQFTRTVHECWWIIIDQGEGFTPPSHECHLMTSATTLDAGRECGRGLYILHQIFDRVYWNRSGNELRLTKILQS